MRGRRLIRVLVDGWRPGSLGMNEPDHEINASGRCHFHGPGKEFSEKGIIPVHYVAVRPQKI